MAVLTRETQMPVRTAPRHALAPRRGSRTAVLIASAIGYTGAFVVAYLLFVRTPGGQRAEDGVVRYAQQTARSTVDWAGPLARLDMVAVSGAAGIGIVALALLRKRFALAVTALVLFLLPIAASQLFKIYLLDRPDVTSATGVPHHNSFPSGHVTAATAVLLALAVALPARFRTWVLVAGAPGVAWVAASTVALSWHRLSDTVGGCLLVAAVVTTGAAVVSARRPDSGRIPPVATTVALLGPVAVVLGGYAVLASATSGPARFVAALVLAALSAVAVVLLAVGPLRRVNFDPAGARNRLTAS